MVKDKFYYIVGVSLLVLLILVVYVGSRAQNLELGLANVDARLGVIETQLNIVSSAAYGDEFSPYDTYTADTLESMYPSYDYVE